MLFMDNVLVIRSRKRTSVGIQVLQDATIKITIPYFFPKSHVAKILDEKKEWIQKAQQKMLSRQQKKVPVGVYLYLGKQYPLSVRFGQKDLIEISDKMYVSNFNEKFFRNHLTSWYKQQARKIIVERVNYYAKIAGLKFKFAVATSSRTRWAKCRGSGPSDSGSRNRRGR